MNGYINNFIDQTRGNIEKGLIGSYEKRWRASINLYYNNVGKVHALILVRMAIEQEVAAMYLGFGVTRKEEDGVPGYRDWLYSTVGIFDNKGVKHYLENLETPIPGLDINNFLIKSEQLIELGIY